MDQERRTRFSYMIELFHYGIIRLKLSGALCSMGRSYAKLLRRIATPHYGQWSCCLSSLSMIGPVNREAAEV